jgi:hypothetical protein
MKIVDVSVLNSNELLLYLDNDSCKIFKMDDYLEGEAFKVLKDINELKKFKLEFGCVEWECGASLSEDTLLNRSVFETKGN